MVRSISVPSNSGICISRKQGRYSVAEELVSASTALLQVATNSSEGTAEIYFFKTSRAGGSSSTARQYIFANRHTKFFYMIQDCFYFLLLQYPRKAPAMEFPDEQKILFRWILYSIHVMRINQFQPFLRFLIPVHSSHCRDWFEVVGYFLMKK